MPSRLADGIPVTTEWLNSLVDAINAGSGSGSSLSTSSSNNIKVLGSFFTGTRPVQIIADEVNGSVSSGTAVFDSTVSFPTPFADSNVIVVVTSAFVGDDNRKNRPFNAPASVALITDKKFELSVQISNDSAGYATGKQVVVNYIAIGKQL